jgi:Tfp pilus assembly protein PilN
MFKKLVTHIVEGKTYFGLEIFEAYGKEFFSLLQLTLKKGELEVVLEKKSEKLDELIPLLNLKAPLFLTINTSKVLKKEVEDSVQDNHELLVVNAFPNLELDNFYYQILKGAKSNIVAISKKEYIDWYVNQLQKMGLSPFSLVIGTAQIDNIKRFVNGEIAGSNFMVSLDDKGINDFELKPETQTNTINLDGIAIQNNSLLNFSHIIGYLQKATQLNNLSLLNGNLRNEFKNLKIFDVGVKASLLFFLVLLLSNFLIFDNYHSKNQKLETNLIVEGQNDNTLQEVKKRILTKEEQLKILSSAKNSRTSYYLDEIAKGLPKSIWLNDIKYQPLVNPVRNDKIIEFNNNNLEISGIINDKIAFTVWSDNLEMQKWIDKVEIIDYEYISNSSANFTVNLVLNEIQ